MIETVLLSSAVVALMFGPQQPPPPAAQQGPKPFTPPVATQQQGQKARPPVEAEVMDAIKRQQAPEISGFSVVLVIGEAQSSGASATNELPAGAQRALNDMREFLPYKHYRVLDSQWTSCCSPKSSAKVLGRLQGMMAVAGPKPVGSSDSNNAVNLVPKNYGFTITAGAAYVPMPIRFVLSADDQVRGGDVEKLRDLQRERQDVKGEIENVQAQMQATQRRIEVGMVSSDEVLPLRTKYESLRRRLADLEQTIEEASVAVQRPIIDSSFTMTAGETVVVGTSKLGGDKALIALVTAVKKAATSRD